MLPLAVAVRPYHEHLRAPDLVREVPLDVLVRVLHLRDRRRVEEHEGVARVPAVLRGVEVLLEQVARDGRDGKLGVDLGVVEVIVLDESCRAVSLQPLLSISRVSPATVQHAHRVELTSG